LWRQRKFGKKNEIYGLVEYGNEECETLVISFPGLGQAMSEKNYLFSNLRKVLSRKGQAYVQFDYRGHGDSLGDMGESSLKSMIEDGLIVIQECILEFHPKMIYLIGNGMGCFVASRLSKLCQDYFSVHAKVICVSPPLIKLPKSSDLFSEEALAVLEQDKALDSQLLIPGYDYYTLSDFDKDQFEFVISLGGHMLYLHGQRLSYELINELNEIDMLMELKNVSDLTIILGELDNDGLNQTSHLPNGEVELLGNVKYFYQHPAAMDQLIDKINELVKQNTHHK
jgi:pimeloyl-ACP methyl ester carboxylesterase